MSWRVRSVMNQCRRRLAKKTPMWIRYRVMQGMTWVRLARRTGLVGPICEKRCRYRLTHNFHSEGLQQDIPGPPRSHLPHSEDLHVLSTVLFRSLSYSV